MKIKWLFNNYWIIIFIYLCGCVSDSSILSSKESGNYGRFCSKTVLEQSLLNLNKQKVDVSFLGDNIFLVIPSDKIFFENSANLNVKRTSILDDVAKFLRCYQKISVQIIVNATILGSEEENLAFSELQARHVGDYLWRRGIKAQLICGKGVNYLEDKFRGKGSKQWVKIITKKLP